MKEPFDDRLEFLCESFIFRERLIEDDFEVGVSWNHLDDLDVKVVGKAKGINIASGGEHLFSRKDFIISFKHLLFDCLDIHLQVFFWSVWVDKFRS